MKKATTPTCATSPGAARDRRPTRSRRWRGEDELFDRYAFCAPARTARHAPQAVWDQGERERMVFQLLTDLDLHHPPCLSLAANRAFHCLASLACNLLTVLKLLELSAEHLVWRCARSSAIS